MTEHTTLDELCVNTIRFLAADAVQKARSGHPGAPMGMAPMAYVLWDRFLRHNPRNPAWPDRDRFILSAGHASMLLYSLLHLTGYDMPLEELQNFRQWGSKTPGHPEREPGVETTTGPLGQGFANAVGMAIAERHLAAVFNRPGHDIINHFTYVIASDGDLQEGVAAEAASLAGTLRLGKLICLYDDNGIQIEGSTGVVFTEDVAKRFEAYGWQVIGPIDGFNLSAVEAAIREAQTDLTRPTLIICRTVIGYGSPNQGTAKVHGEPLGEENLRAAKEKLGWPLEPSFYIPEEVLAHMRRAVERGEAAERAWRRRFRAYAKEYPELAAQLQAQLRGDLPTGWDERLANLFPPDAAMATREASGKALNAIAPLVPALMGGSADLAPSTKTIIDGAGDFSAETPAGRNMHFGVREHAMGAIANGMALHGGLIPYVATFLVFSDYMRPPIRLAAMMGLRVIHVFTHDSIGVGEDGPTHQPIEHLAALRAIPNLTVIRPSDAAETAQAWRAALLNKTGPTALILTRQKVPAIERAAGVGPEGLLRGAYVVWEVAGERPQILLLATGSEVAPAVEAARILAGEGIAARVVAMPSWELFEAQTRKYKNSVLLPGVRTRLAVEAGVRLGWDRYIGPRGDVVCMTRFGASAPAEVLMKQFGFTAEDIAARARALLRH